MCTMRRIFRDDIGNIIEITETPLKIVSLCPSITETLCDMGLHKFLVGRTDFCTPVLQPLDSNTQKYSEEIPTVGGTKNVNVDFVKTLTPDIIFASKEENDKHTIEILSKEHKCFVFEINSIDDSIKMIKTIGEIFINKCDVNELIHTIEQSFLQLPKLNRVHNALYLVWKDPYIAAGKNTYIDSLLSFVGFSNSIQNEKYITLNNLNNLECDIIFLPSEPYKFTEEDKLVIQKMRSDAKILLVDGEMFCWYGSHMVKSALYLKNLVNKINEIETHPLPLTKGEEKEKQ